MAFPFYIAKRYLFSKKSHHAINIISGVSVCGVAIATAALVCIMSVFNGFQDTVSNLFTSFDPQIKVRPAEGKFVPADAPELEQLRKRSDIAVYTETVEDNALLMINNRQAMVTIKGVDDNFEELTRIDKILYGDGVFELHADIIDYGIMGSALLQRLGLAADFSSPVQVYAPRKGDQIDLNDPRESLNNEEFFSPRVCFMVKQNKYDANYVITSVAFARRLFERQGYVSAVELRVEKGCDVDKVKEEIASQLGSKYLVQNRYEQQEDTFKIMQIEKLISYIFLTFIIMIACFNIIGSLTMLIIDKKEDAIILRNLGANNSQIRSIFMLEGRMIATAGAVIGIIIGLLLCWLQQEYELISFGNGSGSYILNAYPVSVHPMDIVIIFITVIVVGWLSVWYPVHHLSKRLAR